LYKGKHLLIDCYHVPSGLCVNDRLLLETLAEGAREGGATVISQIRYQFGNNSPAGCAAIVMLDESHCSAHTYADLGLIALDIFTCGNTDTMRVWEYISEKLALTDYSINELNRFETQTTGTS
jgi:S-adenosylmethionine decarboxylase